MYPWYLVAPALAGEAIAIIHDFVRFGTACWKPEEVDPSDVNAPQVPTYDAVSRPLLMSDAIVNYGTGADQETGVVSTTLDQPLGVWQREKQVRACVVLQLCAGVWVLLGERRGVVWCGVMYTSTLGAWVLLGGWPHCGVGAGCWVATLALWCRLVGCHTGALMLGCDGWRGCVRALFHRTVRRRCVVVSTSPRVCRWSSGLSTT